VFAHERALTTIHLYERQTMAAPDFNPAQKPHVYDLIARLNASFARVTRNLSNLERTGIFEKRTMIRLYRLSKEIQADSNCHLLETLRDLEEHHWARYSRLQRRAIQSAEAEAGELE
jgi:hypothetical protein